MLEEVARLVRPADVAELWAAGHRTPAQVLAEALRLSPEIWVGLHDGVPICAFGVVPISVLTRWGAPWMVGTHRLDGCAFGFIRNSHTVIRAFLSRWSRLSNFVDARNVRAIRWLKRLGFTIQPAVPYGVDQLPFHPFELRS